MKKLPFNLTKEESGLINQRIEEFKKLGKQDTDAWFIELCFCLLTANAQAKKAIEIQNFLGAKGFLNKTEEEIAQVLRDFGHRFSNTKAKYIVLARAYRDIKNLIKDKNISQAREFLVKNIKGLGYKESSHFLRNVGFENIAIIDRHILKFLYKYNYIKEIPKVLNKKTYLKLEDLLRDFNIPLNKLDLMIWCHMTGKVLK